MASSIGIKIANGEFYPIMEENELIKKRLILTTAHDNQTGVQIDLYRSENITMTDAQYIGSLVVDNIMPRPRREPSIEMIVSSNYDGEVVAEAIDLDSGPDGEHYELTVSLKSLDEAHEVDIPDFELDGSDEPPLGLYKNVDERQGPRIPILILFLFIGLVIILGLAAAWLFMFGGLETVSSIRDRLTAAQNIESVQQPEPARQPQTAVEPATVIQTPAVPPASVSQPEPAPSIQTPAVSPTPELQPETARVPEPARQPVPVIQAPTVPPTPVLQPERRRPSAPVASYKVPAVIPRGGVSYVIRYGDTLWDIAEAFYRDPWLYSRIARHNNIANPNHIISGRTIRVPPKN